MKIRTYKRNHIHLKKISFVIKKTLEVAEFWYIISIRLFGYNLTLRQSFLYNIQVVHIFSQAILCVFRLSLLSDEYACVCVTIF